MGVLLAFLLNTRRGYQWCARVLGNPFSFAATALLPLAWLSLLPLPHQSTWGMQVLNLMVTLSVAAVVLRPKVPVLTLSPIAHIGKVSYGIYLLHMLVLVALVRILGKSAPIPVFFAGATIVIIAASISYAFFEAPIIRYYKKRFSPSAVQEPKPTPPSIPTELKPIPIAPATQPPAPSR